MTIRHNPVLRGSPRAEVSTGDQLRLNIDPRAGRKEGMAEYFRMTSLLPLALRRFEAQDGVMIPPQMLMDTAVAHAEQLRLIGIPRPNRPKPSHRSVAQPAESHPVRRAAGRVLVRLGIGLMGPALNGPTQRESACAN